MEGKADRLTSSLIGEAPWLVYTHKNSSSKQNQTFCNMFSSSPNNNFYIKSFPELHRKSIRACCHGWLILHDCFKLDLISMWNPITLESLILPRIPLIDGDDKLLSCLLTSPPNSDNSVLYLFFVRWVYSCRPSFNSTCGWMTHRYEVYPGKHVKTPSVVAVNGDIYAIADIGVAEGRGYNRYIVNMEFDNGDYDSLRIGFFRRKVPGCNKSGCFHTKHYLVESCGHLYCIGVFRHHAWQIRINEIKVWELELSKKIWVEIKSLDDRAFFLSKDSCTWCWGCGSIRKNCVYLTAPHHSEIIYCYSLDDNLLTLLSPCPDYHKHFSTPIWVNVLPQSYNRSLLVVPNRKGQLMNGKLDHFLKHGILSSTTGDKENELFTKLPWDMIRLVSDYLHIFDYWNFRVSCKSFNSAVAPLKQWRTNNSHLFVFFDNDVGLCHMRDPCRDDSHDIIVQLPLDPFTVDFSKDGWLILSSSSKQTMKFYNPLTRMMGDFPPNKQINTRYIRSIGFSTNPMSSDCVTVAFILWHQDGVTIQYLVHGDETWTICNFDRRDYDFDFRVETSSPVYFAGAFYVLDTDGYLGCFELVDGNGRWQVYVNPIELDPMYGYTHHLVECNGELLAVFLGHKGELIQVYKFNVLKKVWTEVECLGNHSLFLGHRSSFSVVTTEEGMRNRIYIPRFRKNQMIFYSLETGKYHVSGCEDSFKDFKDTTEALNYCWL